MRIIFRLDGVLSSHAFQHHVDAVDLCGCMCFCVKSDHISYVTIVPFVDFGTPYGLFGTCGSLHNLNHHLAFTAATWF